MSGKKERGERRERETETEGEGERKEKEAGRQIDRQTNIRLQRVRQTQKVADSFLLKRVEVGSSVKFFTALSIKNCNYLRKKKKREKSIKSKYREN